MDNNLYNKYIILRDDIDSSSRKLETKHKNEMVCRIGCFSCCESITIFPIEYYTIKQELKGTKLPAKKFKHKYGKACRFLINGACSIYNSRPIICRTQGLPLLYENYDGKGYELSVCNLNFKGVDVSKFNDTNALFMPPLNSKLFLLNKEFVLNNVSLKYSELKRLKLNNMSLDG